MKTITTLLLFFCLCISNLQAQEYTKLWNKVETLELEGKVKEANTVVSKILKKAKKTNNSKAIIKSFIYKSKFNATLAENSEAQFAREIIDEIEANSFPTNAILESVYANFLIQFYNNNSYKLKNRTAFKNHIYDINTWDLKHLKKEIHQHLQNSISNTKALRSIKLKDYIEILQGQANTLKFRPTLYDFLVNNAIAFYSGRIVNYQNFYNSLEKEKHNTLSEVFTKTDIETRDSISPIYALKLYQDLERLHLKQKNYYPLFDALINRLKLSNNLSYRQYSLERSVNSNLRQVLKKTIAKYNTKEASSHLSFYLAYTNFNETTYQYYNNTKVKEGTENLRKNAYSLCNKTIKKFPNSEGAIKCKSLKKSLESKFISFQTNPIVSSEKPALAKVTYSNIDTVYLSVYKIPTDFSIRYNDTTVNKYQRHRINYDSIVLQTIKTKKPVLEKEYKLTDIGDFYKHSAEIQIPKLKLGNYLMVVSNTKTVASRKDYAYQTSMRSNLFLTQISKAKANIFRVTDRLTGKSIKNATVNIRSQTKDYNIIKTTNRNGLAKKLKTKTYKSNLQTIVSKTQDSLLFNAIHLGRYYKDDNKDWNAYSELIIDRNIYRPGQDIHFKGYLFQIKNNKRSPVQNIFCTVTIHDSKGNELKEFRLKTNAFGTVSGTYTLPKNILTGEFSIELDEDYDYEEDEHPFWDNVDDFEDTEKDFFVENYKRPKFEILFDKITENYKLGDSIFAKGKANSFFNSKIANAKVSYTITKRNDYKNTIITSGDVTTDNSGVFTMPFIIKNILKSSRKSKQEYTINVTVTDVNGETRTSKKHFYLGNYNLDFNIKLPYIFTNNTTEPLQLTSKNLNEGYIESHGELEISRINDSYSRLHNREWQPAEYQTIPKDTFSFYFPNFKYRPLKEGEKEVLYKTSFKIKDTSQVHINPKNWKSGRYTIQGYAVNKDKDTVTIKRYFHFRNEKEQDQSTLFNYTILNTDFKKDGKIKVQLTTAFKDVYINASVHYKKREIFKEAIVLNKDYILNIPVKEKDNGNITVYLTSNTLGRFKSKSFDIKLTKNNISFNITAQTFRNKLTPDTKETWSFKIQALDKNVELLASMYDESLDDFFTEKNNYYNNYKLDWDYNLEQGYSSRNYYDYRITNLNKSILYNSHGNTFFTYRTSKQRYLKLNYYGLSFANFKYVNKRYLEQLKQKVKYKGVQNPLGNISGIISDENGLPMPGVNVSIPNTTRGTQTDFDGFYSIKAEKGETLSFSSIGYFIEKITIEDSYSINLGLEIDETALDEVVITALGIKRKAAAISSYYVTYSSVSDFEVDVIRKLAGKVSGVQINQNNAGVPEGDRIVLRGSRTFKGNNTPLYVIDGIIVDSNTFTSLNPNSLDTVKVIKGANGSALYGSQGANGVVVITTKFGSKVLDTKDGKKIVDLTEKDINTVEVRKNLKETAFFYPHLKTDNNNEVNINFTAPQALTRWKFQLLAHSKRYKYGYLKLNAITSKALVVTPNLPRFLRVGDTITLAAKVSNLSEGELNGNTNLELYNADTNKPLNTFKAQVFKLLKNGSTEAKWRIIIPEGVSKIRYRITAKNSNFSDGEEGILNVLKQKILVTETVPLYVKGNSKKEFQLKKLREHNSLTLQHDKLTIEYSSNPAWFAFQSLPYLMEYPYDCAEQTFSKYYANALGLHIINSNPKIKDYLKTITPTKTTALDQTSFNTNANSKLVHLFNSDNLKTQEINTIIKLKELQHSSGAFSWFSSQGTPNTFITNHIVASYGHLKKLGVTSTNDKRLNSIIKKAITYLDSEFSTRMLLNNNNIETIDNVHYLYARSFFLESNPLSEEHQRQITNYLKKLETNWVTKSLYNKALIALVFNRFNKTSNAKKVLKALEQSSITNDDFGMYWKANTNSMYWYKSPIETQALLIEAFSEINNDKTSVDNMKLWLLNNKQTNSWKTTKATTEAIYALLLQGNDWLTVKTNSKFKIGDTTLKSNALGQYNITYTKQEITTEKATIEIKSTTKSPGFGGMYWQYYENLDNITAAETPLKLKKKIFRKTNNDIVEITQDTPIKIGDIIRVSMELTSDRNLEFIHLKDMRAAGLEPINVLSGHKYQEGLKYYESTKDDATDFFFDKLPKGIYVFEYDLRVNNAGNMSNGITTIQSMYAPEFTSHSEGIRISVGD